MYIEEEEEGMTALSRVTLALAGLSCCISKMAVKSLSRPQHDGSTPKETPQILSG